MSVDRQIFGSELRWSQNVGYNLGKALEVLVIASVANLAMPFYSISLGVSPALMGAALLIPRLLDAFTDPFMGWVSDNTRSPWGRRRPWMFVGGILTGLLFWLTWTPPVSLGTTAVWLYFLVISTLMYLASTLYLIPYYALGNEITMDHDQRVRVMAMRSLAWGATTLLAPWAYSLYYNPYLGSNDVEGARSVGLIIGGLTALFAVLSVWASRENPAIQSQPRIPFGRAMLEAMKVKPFLIMIAVVTFSVFGFGMVASFNMFVGAYHVFDGDKAAMATLWGYVGTAWGVGAIIFSLFANRIIRRIGEKQTIYWSSILIVIGSVGTWWLYTPQAPLLAVVTTLLYAPGIVGVQMVGAVWLTDICDYDEWKSGVRREGIFSSVKALINKSLLAVASGISGILIALAGINTSALQQTPDAVFNIRVLFATLPGAFSILTIIIAAMYPLTKARMIEIRQDLGKRHAETASGNTLSA